MPEYVHLVCLELAADCECGSSPDVVSAITAVMSEVRLCLFPLDGEPPMGVHG